MINPPGIGSKGKSYTLAATLTLSATKQGPWSTISSPKFGKHLSSSKTPRHRSVSWAKKPKCRDKEVP
jgi:hypothetical protein